VEKLSEVLQVFILVRMAFLKINFTEVLALHACVVTHNQVT